MNKLMLVATLLFAFSSQAYEPVMSDFAYSYKIDFTEGQSVYEGKVLGHVYELVTRPDLGDIRVFNSNAEVVPHQIFLKNEVEVEKETAPVSLKYFPLKAEGPGKEINLNRIKITADNAGAIVEVGPKIKAKPRHGLFTAGYIVDASTIKEPIRGFKFKVTNKKGDHYFRKISIYGSNSLRDWQLLNADFLANLEHQGENLLRDEISLSGVNRKYYRVAWNQKDGELHLDSIEAIFAKTVEVEALDLTWEYPEGVKVVSKDSKGIFLYTLKGYFPVRSIRVNFQQPNSMASITLQARNSENDPWVPQVSGIVYSMAKEGVKFYESELVTRPKRFKYWRLKFNDHQEAFGAHTPKLEFGWEPELLRFLARGTAPFKLGFGNARAEVLETVNLRDEKFKDSVGKALLSEYQVLGGDSKLTYTAPVEHPWKTWILWAVLIIGVFFLGNMAFSLLKTMKEDQSK